MAQKMLAMNSARREATRDNSPLACILSFLVSHIRKKYLNKFMFMCANKQEENRSAIDSIKKIYLYIHMYMQN